MRVACSLLRSRVRLFLLRITIQHWFNRREGNTVVVIVVVSPLHVYVFYRERSELCWGR